MERGRAVSADRLVEAVWGTGAPASARNLLTVYVSQLRRVIGPEAIETRPGGYAAALEPDDLDAGRFESLVAEGIAARAAGNPALAAARLRRAVELWRGPALADVADAEFARPEARRLEELRLACAEESLAAVLEGGNDSAIVAEARALALSQPYRERPWQILMLALYRGGRQAEALEAYREFRARLREQLGLEPSADLRDLQSAILRHDIPPADPRIRHSASTLPAPVTALIGRQSELASLRMLVDQPAVRLVTVCGAGGCGKSRVAIAFAEEMREAFANGVVFVELASVDDPGLVVGAIARRLDLSEQGDEDPLHTLSRWLARRELLLILDNMEHVASAAPTLVELLKAAPMLTILATSRRVLHVSGEHVLPLNPLPIEDALRLFASRVLARDPLIDAKTLETAEAREICRRVDCLPLAVELAAGQVHRLGISGLCARLGERRTILVDGPRDLPARQRTLRDMLAWSTDLLSEAERAQFARLGAVVGSCGTDAAQAVSGGTAESLTVLASHSLLQLTRGTDEPRVSMLETVREHALELLARSTSRDEALQAHAEYYANLIERIDPTREQTSARLRLIDPDVDNFRAAMEWFERTGDDGAALRLATGLYRYWYMRGLLREGRRRLSRPLDRGAGEPALRALALRALAGINLVFGDLDGAEERALEGIATGAETLTLEPVMGCETVLGLAALERGQLREARIHIEQSRTLARELGLEIDVVVANTNLSTILLRAGELEGAGSLWEEVLAWHEKNSAPEDGAFALLGLAAVAHAENRLDDAERLFERTLDLAGGAGFGQLAGHAHVGMAAVAVKRDDYLDAARKLGRADGWFGELGGPSTEFEPALGARTEARARAALGDDVYSTAYYEGRLPVRPSSGLRRN